MGGLVKDKLHSAHDEFPNLLILLWIRKANKSSDRPPYMRKHGCETNANLNITFSKVRYFKNAKAHSFTNAHCTNARNASHSLA